MSELVWYAAPIGVIIFVAGVWYGRRVRLQAYTEGFLDGQIHEIRKKPVIGAD